MTYEIEIREVTARPIAAVTQGCLAAEIDPAQRRTDVFHLIEEAARP
jgi:hypothetical protein